MKTVHFRAVHRKNFELENVAKLTMYCHLRSPDAMPLLTSNLFGPQGHQRPNFDGFLYLEVMHLIAFVGVILS